VSHHRRHFEKTDRVAFSLSVDASKVAQVVQPNLKYGHVVGGAAPNHYIRIPDDDDESSRIRQRRKHPRSNLQQLRISGQRMVYHHLFKLVLGHRQIMRLLTSTNMLQRQ
jgi:hypothetical protein